MKPKAKPETAQVQTECKPIEHDFQSVTGHFAIGQATLGGTGQGSIIKLYCRRCGKVIPL
jgi:hypothetical protein